MLQIPQRYIGHMCIRRDINIYMAGMTGTVGKRS